MSNEQKVTRKLRAIFSADVKGYSILMADDEVSTIQSLQNYRNIMSACVEKHDGRVVDAVGDNLLAEFDSAVDAVQCAVEVQKELRDKNKELSKEKRLEFRIGINIGDVVQEGDRIYGDGVNIAARIEGLADPGGVCISRNAYDHIKNKLELGYEYIGEHAVKNIKDPVRVYKVLMDPEDAGKRIGEKKKRSKLKWFLAAAAIFALLAVGILGGLYWKYLYLPTPENIDPENKKTFELPKGPSIAVLPLDNMTGDPEQEFLCDGITENIISSLSYIPNLFVIARNSTFTYKGKSITAQQVGRELGAQYLLEGSIQKSIDRIRITVQLIEASTGHHKLSEIYDRKLDDIFKLQDEITLAIIQAIASKIAGTERLRGYHDDFTNLHDFLKYLRAISYFHHLSPEYNKMAQKELLEVIDSNPNLPQVYAYLANTYTWSFLYGQCEPPIICFAKASEATRKALSLDENDVNALGSAAVLSLYKKDHENAIAYIKKALSVQPNGAHCYVIFGNILRSMDRSNEAISIIKKGILLNPYPLHWYYSGLGMAYTDSGQYDEAIKAFKKSIEIDPSWIAYLGLAIVYGHLGYEKEAKETVSELLMHRPELSIEKISKITPYKNRDRISFITEALRKAGLPE
jgi:adenylate cyclase